MSQGAKEGVVEGEFKAAGKRYALGIDFGTLSARAVLVDVATGAVAASAEAPYRHGVIEGALPEGLAPLPPGAARQDPEDYLVALRTCVREALREGGAAAGVRPRDVIGIGIDFTSCTLLPVDEEGRPLCWDPRWRAHPDAWACLWKDQTAQTEATAMTERALQRGEPFLSWYGGKIPAESFLPKAWRIIKAAPELFRAAACFLEAGDWIVWQLTGEAVGGVSAASFKALWDGAFPEAYLASLDPRLSTLVREKVLGRYLPPGAPAGGLTAAAAAELGLLPGTPVAVANIDAHAAVPGAGVAAPGTMVIVLGTSACHMCLGEERAPVPGIVGAVRDGILAGYIGFEAGQPAVGDALAWFAQHFTPAAYEREAARQGLTVQGYLERLAHQFGPGETGLIALDWWNGNRSPLADGDLTGVIVGLTLESRPEAVYRALMESAVFGTYEIVRAFTSGGVPVERLRACGGVAARSPLMLQLLADVTGRAIEIAASDQASALGAAIFAAVAAGPARGGYAAAEEAVSRMAGAPSTVIAPDPGRHQQYARLYALYRELFSHFGRGEGRAGLHALKALRRARIKGV